MAVDATVLIVGAGPTGLLLAAELCRRKIDCRLVDANPGPMQWDRATVVHPRSLEIFESLGIVRPLLDIGAKQRVARIRSAGKMLGEIDLSACGSRYGFNIGISEEVTERILTDYLQRQGGKVNRSSQLADLKEDGENLIATVQHDDGAEQVRAAWVVGCDGLHSPTRAFGNIELTGSELVEDWAVFDATIPTWAESFEGNFAYLEDVAVILTALPEHRWRVYLRPSSEKSDLVADATTTLSRYIPSLRFDDVTHPARFHCHAKVAKQYKSGRILLAGDAAHVCSPSQGHGMNSGLHDAFNLAWKLALVCQGRSGEKLLDSYQAERHPIAEAIIASGEAFEKIKHITDPAERRARDQSIQATFKDPKSRHHEVVAEAELDVDYSASPIVMGDRHPALSPGQRLPDTITITHPDGKTVLLHELAFRPGHTALVIAGPLAFANKLAQLESSIKAAADSAFIDATIAVTVDPNAQNSFARLELAAADLLGVGEMTLLVIRPDGHIALRADRDHAKALTQYQSLLKNP